MRNIDIIVQVRGLPDELEVCLASLYGVLPEVADRAPRVTAINPCWERPDIDAVLQVHARSSPGVEVVMTSEVPAGFGVLSSLLRRSAAARRDALVLTSDTIWFEGSLRALVSAGDSGEGIGLVSPRTAGWGCDGAVRQELEPPSAEHAYRQFLALAHCLPRHRTGDSCLEAAHLVTWPLLGALCAAQPDPGEPLPLGPDLAPEARRWAYAALVANRAFVYRRPDAGGAERRLEAGMAPAAMAEAMLAALLPDADGCWSVVVDWSDTVGHHGDGRSADVPAIRALAAEAASGLKVSVVCADAVFRFHGLDKCTGVRHLDPAAPGRHAVALRMHVPDSEDTLAGFHRLAPITLCVAPPALARLEAREQPSRGLWRSLARHANAVLFTSAREQAYFDGLQPADEATTSHLLPRPAALEAYRQNLPLRLASHILVMGEEADGMADQLQTWFPALPLVCLGRASVQAQGLRRYRADAISPESVHELIGQSHAIVFTAQTPAWAEHLLQALAAGKPLVMQRSANLEELLNNYASTTGVFMYDTSAEAEALVRAALTQGTSAIDDTAAPNWDDWAAGVAALVDRLRQLPTLFTRLQCRLVNMGDTQTASRLNPTIRRAGAVNLDHLLAHENGDFIRMTYWTFLNRQADVEGEKNFLYALNSGKSKLEIIDMIQGSPEGSIVNAKLAGYTPLNRSDEVTPRRIVLVLGMHRSGTSALTRGLQALGVELGDNLYPPRPGENPKGYFEDADISNFDDQLLASIGRDWQHFGQVDASAVEQLRSTGVFARAVDLIRAKSAGKSVLGVKDPRISKLLPFWLPVFDELGLDQSFVLAVRNPCSVAKSLEVRNGFSRQKSYVLWLDHTLGSLGVVGRYRFAITDYDHLLLQPEDALRTVARRLDLYLDAVALREYATEFLDSNLRHADFGADDVNGDPACFPLVREVYARLQQLAMDNQQADCLSFMQVIVKWKAAFAIMQTTLDWVQLLAADNLRLRAALGSEKSVADQARGT